MDNDDKSAALSAFITGQQQFIREGTGAVEAAKPALERLVAVMRTRTGQAYKVRALLYSLWNGQPTSLIEVVTLDWEIRRDFGVVLLAFGFEDGKGTSFFYDDIKNAVADQFQWFISEEAIAKDTETQ